MKLFFDAKTSTMGDKKIIIIPTAIHKMLQKFDLDNTDVTVVLTKKGEINEE